MINVNVNTKPIIATVTPQPVRVGIDVKAIPSDLPTYTGDYIVEPNPTADVVIATKGMVMQDNVTVKKIPSNYGLIVWDGSELLIK